MIFYSKLGEGSDTEWEARKNDAEIRYLLNSDSCEGEENPLPDQFR
jgi:hypothetical protein